MDLLKYSLFCFLLNCFCACTNDSDKAHTEADRTEYQNQSADVKFQSIDSKQSGIDFVNAIDEYNPQMHYLAYPQLYHGAGVAAGDLDNDGLTDIFFQSSFGGGKLYRNKGSMKFEPIDLPTNLFNRKAVGAGVTLVDINQDGLLDIYLCYSGPLFIPQNLKANKLLINQGNFSFKESAAEYGLDNKESSFQASFFDYDKDGDLDMYLVNTNADLTYATQVPAKAAFDFKNTFLRDLQAQDRLYRNDGGKFTDVTAQSGLKPEMFYGFNASIGDFNNDNYPDIFVTNDFYTPDLLYINNQNGTFTESSLSYFKHTSFNSMGCDVADLNNDGLDDLIVLDMSPEDYIRNRENMTMTDPAFFDYLLKNNYGHQYMHNTLQINAGKGVFQEISQFAGIDKTDWSWAVLSEDFDNDGYKDMYITNGIVRDINDTDAHNKRTQWIQQKSGQGTLQELKDLINSIPSIPVSNYLFINQKNMTFKDYTKQAELDIPGFSQGAATADFDNDGDIDIVVNNSNTPALLLENTSPKKNYIQFQFKGTAKNKNGIGAKICIHTNETQQCSNMYTSRGYMSSTDYRIHFGLGADDKVDFCTVIWNNGQSQKIISPKINTLHTITYQDAKVQAYLAPKSQQTLFTQNNNIPFKPHIENEYNDFKEQLLLPHKLSDLGPALATGDLNNDQLTDIFIGGGKNQEAAVYVQNQSGEFASISQSAFIADKKFEDTDALFFDFDNDKDLDIFVTSGSYEYAEQADELTDRLYLNDGKGNFKKYNYGTPIKSNSMTVTSADIDKDGDKDLFVGGRVIKGKYPSPPKSYLLINNNGKLIDKTNELAPQLAQIGMITDAEFTDIDQDDDMDLVVVGEWLPICFFENTDGKLNRKTTPTDEKTYGWWNTLKVADINNDGKSDLIVGNLGLNYKFSASENKPLQVFGNDFDTNGSFDVVLAKPIKKALYPVRGRECSSEKMPFIGEKFPTFGDFARADITDIYGQDIDVALKLKATKFEHCTMIQKTPWAFEINDLPPEAQLAPVKTILYEDFNSDGIKDILLMGNLFGSEIETTRADAGIGTLLLGKKDGIFEYINNLKSGIFADTDVRKMKYIDDIKKQLIIVSNNDKVRSFTLN